jgi:hypothetical protein
MFLTMLGGALVVGAGLLVTASYSEGTLLAARTAALVMGWLFVMAALAGTVALRQPSFGKVTAAGVSLCSGLLLVYAAHFEWSELAHAVPARQELKMIEAPSPTLAAALGLKEVVLPAVPSAHAEKPLLAATIALSPGRARCSDKAGIAWLFCQEAVRLEYCESGLGDEATCPSPIPAAYPG